MKKIKIIKVGTRFSRLALIQTETVVSALRRINPDIEFEVLRFVPSGDVVSELSVDALTAKGQFSDALENALKDGSIDIAVHSLKDLPFDSEFPVYAYSEREDARDVLVLPITGDKTLPPISFSSARREEIPSPIGFSSARRGVQIADLYRGISIKPIRGNVPTRLQKLDRGEYGSLVLAAAGLHRLGLKGRVSRYFDTGEIVPAAGQGILAVQGRRDGDYGYLKAFDCETSRRAALLEQTIMMRFGGGCASPCAAYAEFHGELASLTLLYSDGKALKKGFVSANIRDIEDEGKRLADRLADELRKE
ncbi:MAG: hydroxymethylbilane synthase [Clostridiales bacterium]|jgi:hydroxymethylbilane synthase|nr:hydroxymethylbilane synthase [Clostridiales bacterium]